MSDGGEGLLEAVGGTVRTTTVPDMLGRPIEAQWRLLDATSNTGPTAVIEMAQAAGRALLAHPGGEDPVRADTTGVGQLLLAARDAGATHIIVGCGGSATTDGGWGAVEAVGSPAALAGISVVVASDVTTAFGDAARVYGPQKGATPEQVRAPECPFGPPGRALPPPLRHRRVVAARAPGPPGASPVASPCSGPPSPRALTWWPTLRHLGTKIAACDLVVTGEGHLDPRRSTARYPAAWSASPPESGRSSSWSAPPTTRWSPCLRPGVEIVSLSRAIRHSARPARAPSSSLARSPKRRCTDFALEVAIGNAARAARHPSRRDHVRERRIPWDYLTAKLPSSPEPAEALAAKRP